jgi:hypothetical protein
MHLGVRREDGILSPFLMVSSVWEYLLEEMTERAMPEVVQ